MLADVSLPNMALREMVEKKVKPTEHNMLTQYAAIELRLGA